MAPRKRKISRPFRPAFRFLAEWKDWVPFVAVFLALPSSWILRRWLQQQAIDIGVWVLALPLVALIGYAIHWMRRRRRAKRLVLDLLKERATHRSAFRLLAPFGEGDRLPGRDRVNEARLIATRIASDDFRFGVVCGDPGCGKTSLLRSEVTRCLKVDGFDVAYVRNQRRLEPQNSEVLEPEKRLATELRTLSKLYIKPSTKVLILDQFEEWFIEYPQPEHRILIGHFIQQTTHRSHPIRILCAVRRDFLIDFHDLRGEVSEPLSASNLFHIKNLTIDQAINVIRECALSDSLKVDESFAETIAHDLSEGGEIRPPELQIVCTRLATSGSLSMSKYGEAGGTAGLLAHFIQESLSSCRFPDVAARMLRALCDFPARAKRKPKTIDELIADTSNGNQPSAHMVEAVTETTLHFVNGRILIKEDRKGRTTFALMHDYLIDAVQLATSDASTKSEEATNLLRYYLAQQRGNIPLRRVWYIRRFAERKLLKERAAKQLLRKSFLAPVLRTTLTISAAIFLTAILFLVVTGQIQWSSEIIGRHWKEGESGFLNPVSITKDKVATGLNNEGEYLCLWDSATGRLLNRFNKNANNTTAWTASGQFLAFNNESGQVLLANLKTAIETPLTQGFSFTVSKSEDWITGTEIRKEASDAGVVYVYSTKDAKVVCQIRAPQPPYLWSSQLVIGNRLVVSGNDGTQIVARVYELPSGKLIATLKDDQGGDISAMDATTASSEIAILSRLPSGDGHVSFWNLSDGSFLDQTSLTKSEIHDVVPESTHRLKIRFTPDGSRVIITGFDSRQGTPPTPSSEWPGWVINSPNAGRCLQLPGDDWHLSFRRAGAMLFWSEDDATAIWDGTDHSTNLIRGLTLADNDTLLITEKGDRAVSLRGQDVELWDTIAGTRIAKLTAPGLIRAIDFTLDDSAVVVLSETDLALFDPIDGRLIIEHFKDPENVIKYDPSCRRFLVWNTAGQVVRYTEGRKIFSKFVPSRRCE